LRNVIEAIHDLPGFNHRIGLMGSSLGGFLAILTALEYPDIEALALWATPVSLKQFSSRLQKSPLLPFSPSKAFLEDLRHYEPMQHLKNISKALVLHGAKDDLVDPSNAWTIFKHLSNPKSLHILSETDHRISQEKSRTFAFSLTCRWFRRYLG
jgi:esterase/lipase